MDLTDKELVLMRAIHNSHRDGMPQPEHIQEDAKALVARGLVAESGSGFYVPDEVKWRFLADGQPLGR